MSPAPVASSTARRTALATASAAHAPPKRGPAPPPRRPRRTPTLRPRGCVPGRWSGPARPGPSSPPLYLGLAQIGVGPHHGQRRVLYRPRLRRVRLEDLPHVQPPASRTPGAGQHTPVSVHHLPVGVHCCQGSHYQVPGPHGGSTDTQLG